MGLRCVTGWQPSERLLMLSQQLNLPCRDNQMPGWYFVENDARHATHAKATSRSMCYFCSVYYDHRHRIDKYLDTFLANQPISDGEATDRCQKVAPQDGGLPELIVARSCLTNHSVAASLWLVTPKQDVVGNHQWRHWHVVCCNVEDLNFGMQNLRRSYIKFIF